MKGEETFDKGWQVTLLGLVVLEDRFRRHQVEQAGEHVGQVGRDG